MGIRQWSGALGRRNALAAMVGTVALVACNGDGGGDAMEGECVEVPATVTTATVALTNGNSFTFELNRTAAPNSVQNFIDKARCGALTGTIFHRVEDWVIQGGDPVTKGERGKDYYIQGADQPQGNVPAAGLGGGKMPTETSDQPFEAGAVGFARGADPNLTNDSQFFVLRQDARHLDGGYTYIGKITAGLEVVRAIQIGDKIAGVTFQ